MRKLVERTHPLQCRKCKKTVLPDQPVCLRKEVWVLRYICIYCSSRWHAVKSQRQWVLVEVSGANSPTASDDDGQQPAIAA